jgi:hypothetical protein
MLAEQKMVAAQKAGLPNNVADQNWTPGKKERRTIKIAEQK